LVGLGFKLRAFMPAKQALTKQVLTA
jgi:hypothetical protein